MSRFPIPMLATLALALSSVMPLRAQTDPVERDWSLSPATATAGQEFSLSVLSYRYTCANRYANQKVVVNEQRIDLSFTTSVDPLVLCPAVERPYGPAFKMPALKAGRYALYMNLLLECHVQEPMCKAAIQVESAGTLVVSETGKVKGWFLKSREAMASSPFNLQVVNNDYGNCNTSFEHSSLVVRDGKIDISFVIVDHPERVCVTDIRPHGPTFAMQGMKPGRYPVTVQVLPACVYATPSCQPVILLPAPAVVDTLVVSQALALGGPARPAAGALAAWRDGALSVRLPEGATGIWGVDVLSLSGHRLHKGQVAAGNGAATGLGSTGVAGSLLGMRKPERGMVLVRVTSPALETHTVKLPVKD